MKSKRNKLVNVRKKKQTRREQISGYQQGEGSVEGQHRGVRGMNYYV